MLFMKDSGRTRAGSCAVTRSSTSGEYSAMDILPTRASARSVRCPCPRPELFVAASSSAARHRHRDVESGELAATRTERRPPAEAPRPASRARRCDRVNTPWRGTQHQPPRHYTVEQANAARLGRRGCRGSRRAPGDVSPESAHVERMTRMTGGYQARRRPARPRRLGTASGFRPRTSYAGPQSGLTTCPRSATGGVISAGGPRSVAWGTLQMPDCRAQAL